VQLRWIARQPVTVLCLSASVAWVLPVLRASRVIAVVVTDEVPAVVGEETVREGGDDVVVRRTAQPRPINADD
jgi:hypothetical protein